MARAICWASGLIEFLEDGMRKPNGAIVFASDDSVEALKDKVSAVARHGYDGSLLVPGVPEASDGDKALEAMLRWRDWAFPATEREVQ